MSKRFSYSYHDHIALPRETKMYNWCGYVSATLKYGIRIKGGGDVQKIREFLNTGIHTENPAHPMDIANICKHLISPNGRFTGYRNKDLKDLCKTWIGKAEAIDKEYPEFKLN